jgi:hypothetical protein
VELRRLDLEDRTTKPNKQVNSLSHLFFMKQKNSAQEDLLISNCPATTAHSYFLKKMPVKRGKNIEDVTGRRKDIKFYFRVIKKIFYERVQPDKRS